MSIEVFYEFVSKRSEDENFIEYRGKNRRTLEKVFIKCAKNEAAAGVL